MTKQHYIRLTLENKTLFTFQKNEIPKKSLMIETTSTSSVLTTFSMITNLIANKR